MAKVTIRIQPDDFDIAAEIDKLSNGRRNIGAIVSFTGICRDDGDVLEALELEHYPGMAETEIDQIAAVAVKRFSLTGMTAIHRYGHIKPGENIVLVLAAAPHRQAAFDGANYLMDYLKTRAPFWKKEHRRDGLEGKWVDAKDADDDALRKWDDT